jgi:hypothetical protein
MFDKDSKENRDGKTPPNPSSTVEIKEGKKVRVPGAAVSAKVKPRNGLTPRPWRHSIAGSRAVKRCNSPNFRDHRQEAEKGCH